MQDKSTQRRSGYKHYRNSQEPGAAIFATTTVLDFVHVFSEPEQADLMTASLLDDCRHYGAMLAGFVVMPHHIHLLVRAPDAMSPTIFMGRVKANSALLLRPQLSEATRLKFSDQSGLGGRQFLETEHPWVRN